MLSNAGYRLDGRVALVTGASRGIGRACALDLALHGAAVACLGRDADRLDDIADEIRAGGGTALALVADVADEQAIVNAVKTTVAELGGLDVLVNNAGIAGGGWTEVLATDLTAPFLLVRESVEHLAASGRGAVVNVGSINGVVAMRELAAYCAAKGGLHHLTRQLALDLAPRGIRVNCVAPGFIDTDMFDRSHDAERRAHIAKLHALGRVGEPEEVAAAITFLASDRASFVTGAVLLVDGGLTTQFGLE